MKILRIKPLSLALVASFAISQVALADATPSLREDVSVSPGRVITPADEAVISSSASKVLHHIARARDALRNKDGEQAKAELKQAATLLDIIQASVPTSLVKSRIWTVDNKLQYENSEEVGAAMVPVYATLDERADFDQVKLPASAKAAATIGARGNPPPVASEEAEAKDAVLYFEELDMPLNATRHFVAAAQSALAQDRFSDAGQALRAALNNLDFTSVNLPAPLLAARINLERAARHFGDGKTPQAKADVARAVVQLNLAASQADPDSLAEVKQMLSDAQSLQTRIDNNAPSLKAELKGLWRRADAQADRALAFTRFGWAKLRQHDGMRGALIEAKRYVAYADIDANVAGDANKAMLDLKQAKTWLNKAAEASAKDSNGQDAAVQVKDIRAVLDTLLAGQAKPDKGEMANLKQQLSQTISRS